MGRRRKQREPLCMSTVASASNNGRHHGGGMTLYYSSRTGHKAPFSIARDSELEPSSLLARLESESLRWWLPMKKIDKEDEDERFFEEIDSTRIACCCSRGRGLGLVGNGGLLEVDRCYSDRRKMSVEKKKNKGGNGGQAEQGAPLVAVFPRLLSNSPSVLGPSPVEAPAACHPLNLYLNLPVCSCDAGAQLAAHKEKERVHQFLIGLNPDFSTIRSQILSMDPLPTVNRAHSMAAHDETQRLITQDRDSSSEALGFAAKIANEFGAVNPNFVDSNRGDFKSRGRLFCDLCGRNGHHRATCYQLHGYPYSDQSNQRSSKGFPSGQSQYGGKTGGSSFYVPAQKGHMAAQAQAHGDQLADLSKLAHLSEGPHLGEYDWNG
ncbi:hypothetical protein CRG98_029030 [Punica granatum]|uniref:CCHC-type domain-containing protein n=1 Tax=Punica granatum TaxID=22663 RepID=A0A2I0J3R4_PUNGR|nr:hypothetical protein CRG98_029030 [Punica granatum]